MDKPGRRIGGYTLERPLGEGGMGRVWLARRSDGRSEGRVAIKVPTAGRPGEEGTARLAHRNIAHLLDVGVDGDRQYLVLEYVEGEPIDRWCDVRRLGVAARIRLFLQVLDAVSHAHGRMILHRDLKPSNVLVTAHGVVKLLDFGSAPLHGATLTFDYAAPEQVLRTELTTATDVYALGVMLYVLLTGKHPTAGDGSTPFERLRALAERDPAPASEAALSTRPLVARALRGDLDNILAKALKKSLLERYTTVDAFAEDLKRYLEHQPVSARPDSQTYRLSKFVRRHRLTVAAASVAMLTLLGGTAGIAWHAVEARYQSRGVAELRPLQAGDALPVYHSARYARLLITAADAALSEGRVADAEEYARTALQVSETIAHDPETSADVGESLLRLANALVAQGDYATAFPLLQRAEQCLSNGLGEEHPLTQRARTIPGVMLAQGST